VLAFNHHARPPQSQNGAGSYGPGVYGSFWFRRGRDTVGPTPAADSAGVGENVRCRGNGYLLVFRVGATGSLSNPGIGATTPPFLNHIMQNEGSRTQQLTCRVSKVITDEPSGARWPAIGCPEGDAGTRRQIECAIDDPAQTQLPL